MYSGTWEGTGMVSLGLKKKKQQTNTHTHISKTIFSENCIITHTEMIPNRFNNNSAQPQTSKKNHDKDPQLDSGSHSFMLAHNKNSILHFSAHTFLENFN
jgi:hypothetical protein